MNLIQPDALEPEADKALAQEKRKSRLNTAVAIAVALFATLIGVCKIKGDNIVQGMQQAQANRIDDWSLYQARNLRAEIARAAIAQLQLLSQPPTNRAAYTQQVKTYQDLATKEVHEKAQQRAIAEADQTTDDALNVHDDPFDLSDAAWSIASSLFAITSLSQKRWLLGLAAANGVWGRDGVGWITRVEFASRLFDQAIDAKSTIPGLESCQSRIS